MKAKLKPLFVWAGRILLAVALVFVGLKLRSHWSGISGWRPDAGDILLLTGLAVFYGGTLFMLAEGWHRIVNLFGREPRSRTYPSFTTTQIAKYLPGNIAHLVGRGLYLHGNTLSGQQIVKATLIELAIIPAGAIGCVVLLGATGHLAPLFPHIPLYLWWVAALLLLAGLPAARAGARRLGVKSGGLLSGLLTGGGLAGLFMASLGATFAAIFLMLGDAPFGALAGAAILAWLAGFLTPGAPGGVGIREAAFIALLAGLGQDDSVLIAAGLFRIVTTVGDVILFAAGRLIRRWIAPENPA